MYSFPCGNGEKHGGLRWGLDDNVRLYSVWVGVHEGCLPWVKGRKLLERVSGEWGGGGGESFPPHPGKLQKKSMFT